MPPETNPLDTILRNLAACDDDLVAAWAAALLDGESAGESGPLRGPDSAEKESEKTQV